MIGIEIDSKTKHVLLSFDGDGDWIDYELTVVLAVWKKILERDCDEDEAQRRFANIIFSYVLNDIDALATSIMKDIEVTATEE